jgi:hypothetical protein
VRLLSGVGARSSFVSDGSTSAPGWSGLVARALLGRNTPAGEAMRAGVSSSDQNLAWIERSTLRARVTTVRETHATPR